MTEKENQIVHEMVDLSEKIRQEMEYINTHERIPQLQLDYIVSKVKSLYEKSIVLSYLHSHIDEIIQEKEETAVNLVQEETIEESVLEPSKEREVQPEENAIQETPKILTTSEKISVNEKIGSKEEENSGFRKE